MDEAGSYVHQTNIKLRPPKKVPTPYGGRLVYVLPGKTKLFVHLKVCSLVYVTLIVEFKFLVYRIS